ncbi:MAG: hypothetical protein A2X83_06275 [Desulfuromonadales bacterium GWD2_54_10]|nr:MAG: hypothetical protein A2X83_06275 [Desulfuromonadales bacterium GWD2_54_10]
MKISRYGSSANHGTNSIELKKVNISWNSKENCIAIKSNNIRDFNTESKHNYEVSIPLNDLAEIFKALGNEGVSLSAMMIGTSLENSLKALNRITAAASGIIPAKTTG